jgi:hypothetical protein
MGVDIDFADILKLPGFVAVKGRVSLAQIAIGGSGKALGEREGDRLQRLVFVEEGVVETVDHAPDN